MIAMNKIHNNNGFTIIELMIAMAIFAIVITGIYQSYTQQHMSYLVQEQTATMQQNYRAAMLMVSKDLRQAHCFLGTNGFVENWASDTGGLKNGLKAYDNYDFDSSDNGASWDNGSDEGQGPDRVDVAFSNIRVNASIATKIMPSSSSNLEVWCRDQGKFAIGDILVISDGVNANIFEITSEPGGTACDGEPPNSTKVMKYQMRPGGTLTGVNQPSQGDFPDDGYALGSMIFKLKYVSYAVDKISYPDNPRMMVDLDGPLPLGPKYVWQPVAHNIEDFQCEYVFADGEVADFPDDEDGDDSNDYEDVRSVRFSILARADRIIPGYTPRVVQDRDGNDLPQNYIRRWYDTEVKLRNLGLHPVQTF